MLARLVLVLVLAVGTAFAGTPAEAAGVIRFGRIQYDSPGSDTGSTSSLNAEYVVITNTSSTARSLTGWSVRDATGYTYRFGTFTLGGRKSVVLRTGRGTNTSTTRYWGRTWYVWNNSGDKAYLRNASGAQMDYCTWGSVGPGYKSC